MKLRIYNVVEKDKKSNLSIYTLSIIAGVILFFIFLGLFKGGLFLIKTVFGFVMEYWVIMLGGLLGLLLLKRLLFRRKIPKGTRRDEMYEQEM